jgi:hypothetical protein
MNMEVEESMAFGAVFRQPLVKTADWEDLVHAVATFKVCKLVKMLQLILLKLFKNLVDPVTYPTHMYNHLTRDKI